MSSSNASPSGTVSAEYVSPTGTETFQYSDQLQRSNGTSKSSDQTAYISAIRTKVSKMQNDINAFLTRKMEEDKVIAATNGNGSAAKVDEDKEEENYGEEADDVV